MFMTNSLISVMVEPIGFKIDFKSFNLLIGIKVWLDF